MALRKAESSKRHPARPVQAAASPTAAAEAPQDDAAAPLEAGAATHDAQIVQMPKRSGAARQRPAPAVRPPASEPTPRTPAPEPAPEPIAESVAEAVAEPMTEPAAAAAPDLAPVQVPSAAPVAAPDVEVPDFAALGLVGKDPGPAGGGGAAPASLASEVPHTRARRVLITKRGKKDYTYSWAKSDVAEMKDAWRRWRSLYNQHWTTVDPEGEYRLVWSSFLAAAVTRGLADPQAWIGSVRNDARKQRVEGGSQQVGLVWPVAVDRAVVDVWEEYEGASWPDGFSLTKQNVAAAAILHALKSVEEWVFLVPNDDRFSVPVEDDGRLRANVAERV